MARCEYCPREQRLPAGTPAPRGWVRLEGGRFACVGCKLLRRHDPLHAPPALVQCACGVKTTERDAASHRARCSKADNATKEVTRG